MKRIVARALVAGALALAAAPVGAQTLYRITDIGMLLGCASSSAFGLNNQNDVVGSCGPDTSLFSQSGWIDAAGVVTPTGKLTGGTYSQPVAINSSGAAVGNGDAGNGRPQAVLFRGGQVINIDPVSGGNAYAIGITDTGVIFGDLTTSLSGSPSSWRAVTWTEDPSHPGRFRRTALPLPTGGTSKSTGVFALGSSNSGLVVGWATNNLIGQQGALWNNDSAHTLIVLPTLGTQSIAQAVNNFGQVAGYSTAFVDSHAVIWGNDAAHTITDLGTLAGDNVSQANGINDAGQAIGMSYNTATGSQRPFIYTAGRMFPLASLLDASGAGWTITQATAINNSGQIVGSGLLNGTLHAFLMTPLP